jgi:hypothetical protein
MVKGKVLLFSLLLIFATSVYAGEVHNCNSEVYYSTGCTSMYLLVCPAGDFMAIRDACGGSGDYIRVVVKDDTDAGIPGIPWTDYWMDACDTGQALYLCASGVTADSLTNSNGETTISDPIAAGGCILSGGVYLAVQNVVIEGSACSGPICLNMVVKSPDLTKDGKVNLSDFGAFSDSFGTEDGVTPPAGKTYDPCCDYSGDNRINLSDFGYFSDHFLHECQ